MNLETVQFKELVMSTKNQGAKFGEIGGKVLRALGSVPLSAKDLPVPGVRAWSFVHKAAVQHRQNAGVSQ